MRRVRALFLRLAGFFKKDLWERDMSAELESPHGPRRLSRAVVPQVLSDGVRPMLVGWPVGLAGAYAVTGLIQSLLFGVAPVDAPTYLLTFAILAAVAVTACAVPAARAIRVDPLVSLREQ